MEFSFPIYGAITSLFLFYYFILRFRSKAKPAPPRAGGARLFTGHLHLMGGGASADKLLPHMNLARLADIHGPVFTIRLGVHEALVVSNREVAEEVFTRCDAAVSSRPRLRAAKHLGYDFAMFGFSPYGAYWRDLRKLISVELLSPRRIELQRDIRVSETVQFVNELYDLWEKKKEGCAGSVLVEMKEVFGELNLNVLLRMVVGKRIALGGDAEETRRWREVMRDFFYLAGLFVPADAFSWLGWLDIGGYEKRMKETATELEKIVGGWLSEHREKEYSGQDRHRDFMDIMISVVGDANLDGQYDADTIIKSTCQSLIVAGSDTTTVMLIWAVSLILNNRHVLEKAQQELDRHVGRDRRVKESDIRNLVYLQAIVKETLRLYPAGPLGSAREFTRDCIVGGYHVPKGTWLIVNLWKLHRDPEIWGDHPLEFRPDRFLDNNLDPKGQDFEFIPFGAGRRICPGINFGLHMMHLVLAHLMQAFDLSTLQNHLVDMTESGGLTNLKLTPLHLLLTPRLPSTLYQDI